jgi:radical SAM superfamily enzyme YgiQ (UPF0313 family)
MDYSSWYEKRYPALSGFGLWLRGGELNTVPASEFERRPFRVLIARLSTWRDTADSFTHKLLYQIVSRIDNTYPDLAYLPPPKDTPIFDAEGVPWLIGATSKREARDFSVLALSLSIVQELINIPVVLRKSGIPLSKKERLHDPACPLVILGGASALYTSALFNNDPPVDGIFIGDNAPTIQELFRRCGLGGYSKDAVLAELRGVPGFFEPDRERSTEVFQSPELPGEQLLEQAPVLYANECIGKAHLQISEGCACSCSFCAESFGRKPYREFGPAVLREAAVRQKAAMGAHDVEVYSFNFSMHSGFYPLLRELSALFPSVGLKSQRIDSFAADPELANYLHAVGKTSITCGIEGISPRLRRYLNKGLDEADLQKGLRLLLSSPLRELKIFLIATGLENGDDYERFRELLAFIKETMSAAARSPRIIFSMTILVRFPWTPLEFEDAPDSSACQSVLDAAGRLVRAAGFEFRASSGVQDYWISQVLARADGPAIGNALRQAQEETGFVYYRAVPASFIHRFRIYFKDKGLNPDALLAGSPPHERAAKPWNALHTGVPADFLIKQLVSAVRHLNSGEGVKFPELRVSRGPAQRPYTVDELRNELKKAKTQEADLAFRVRVGPALAGVPHAARSTALARALMLTDARLVEGYRGPGPSPLFDCRESDWVVGGDRCVLVWGHETAALLRTLMDNAAFIGRVNMVLDGWETLAGLAGREGAPVATVTFRSPFNFDPSAYWKNKSLKLTLHKTAPGRISFSLSKESLKKKLIDACSAHETPRGTWCVVVKPGPRFDPEEFARTAFTLPSENEWVRISMIADLG